MSKYGQKERFLLVVCLQALKKWDKKKLVALSFIVVDLTHILDDDKSFWIKINNKNCDGLFQLTRSEKSTQTMKIYQCHIRMEC